MKRLIFSITICCSVVCASMFFALCTKKPEKGPLNEIKKYIDDYYDASLGESSNPKSGKSSVYIDFSDGLFQAYTKNNDNNNIISKITGALEHDTIEWWGLSDGRFNPLGNSSKVIYNKITNVNEYKKNTTAPIDDALKKITYGNNDALLVTDYEEYSQDMERTDPYPQQYFKNWLNKGNSITFFYTRSYVEINGNNKSNKHLYFTVFTHGRANDKSMISKVRNVLKINNLKPCEFTLNNNPYTIFNRYGGKDNTGLQNKQFIQNKTLNINACLDKNLPYEVIGIKKPWDEKIDQVVTKYINGKENRIFMAKLFINASDQSSYKLNKVSVKVYDVTNDYVNYAKYKEAIDHKPTMTKDKGKNDVWSENSKKDPIVKACYQQNKTELKKECVYTAGNSESIKELKEIFAHDESIFSNHMKKTPNDVELITTIHNNYKLANVNNSSALLRIDYVIEDITFNNQNPQLEDFRWKSITKPGDNPSLIDAIKNTLQDPTVSPKGKILYSYYIKFANKSEK